MRVVKLTSPTLGSRALLAPSDNEQVYRCQGESLRGERMVVQKKEKADIKGRKIAWNELLQYQEGAVVSRTLIDKKVGTVTMDIAGAVK